MNARDLTQSFDVILNMLEARGIDISETRATFTCNELEKVYLNSPVQSSIDIIGKARLFYMNQAQMRRHITKYDFESDKTPLHIIVLVNNFSPPSSKSLYEAYSVNKRDVEVFKLDEVKIDIAKHMLVPKHELLTKEEEQKVLTTYMCTRFQLPQILKSDPMARYLGLKHGQMIRIMDRSLTAGEYVHYRTCAAGITEQ
jgi:DNA-directed RNA polymerase subunit H (RpoH/RPB5)